MLYFGGLLLSIKGNNKAMYFNLWVFFILYLLLFINLTLFDPLWSRNGLKLVHWSKDLFDHYLHSSFNIIPFKTIYFYLERFDSMYSNRSVLFNLVGNFVCLMPMALFLPLLFKKQNKWFCFIITCTLFIIGIELLQFFTMSGNCDIDDLILNVIGATMMYGIIKIKSVRQVMNKIFLYDSVHVRAWDFGIAFFIFLSFGIIILAIVKYRIYLYNRKYNDYISAYSYSLKIVDETSNCDPSLELFYEDDLYIYYYDCIKSDKVYATVNGNEKYLVKDLLNGNTKYQVSIDRIIHQFDYDHINYIKEGKYSYLDVSSNNRYTSSPDINVEVTEQDILETKIGDSSLRDNIFEFILFLIPLKKGDTDLFITLSSDKIIESYHYHVMVDDQLQVKYE